MKYTYQDIKNNIIIDKYKYINIVENWKIFLKIMLDLKSYLVEFDWKKNIKDNIYNNNY